MHEARAYDLWVNGTKPGMRWQVRWDERDPATGRLRRPGRKFPTEAKAKTFAKVVNEKLDAGSAAPSTDGKALFAEVATAWQRSRREVKASHRDRAARELRTWVLPRFGNREVGSIRRREVQQFAFDLLDGTAIGNYTTGLGRARAPLAPTSVRSIVGQVRGVLAYAIEDEVMTTANPVTGIRVGKIEKTKTNFLTFAEVERLRNLVAALPQGEQHALVVQVMAYCGLRIGEVLLLRHEDLRLARRRIVVSRSWTTEATKWVVGTTKTGKTRSAPVSASLAAELAAHLSTVEPGGYLFCGPRGTAPWQPDNWRSRVWKRAVAGSEFEVMNLTPHDLRHTAASMAIAAGAEVVAVQSMLGHASATETLNTYAHLWPDRLDTITDAVEAARKAALGLAT